MPQKWLSVVDFEKSQHYKQRNPPWIKVYRSMLGHPEFMKLPVTCKYLYIGLIILASECDNRVLNDPSWIAHRLSISPSEIDLKPLYKSGFLLASDASIRRYHQESREEERREETEEKREQVAPARKVSKKLSDEEWLKELKANPAYRHINIDDQLGKMDAWLSVHPGRQKSRPFIVNWLNKIEKPLAIVPLKPAIMTKVTPSLPPGEECPEGAQELLSRLMGGIGKAM